MAQKFIDEAQFDAPITSNSKLFVNGTLWDNGGNQGTAGQVLTKDGSNNIAWETPSGGGGSITGSGTNGTMTKWSGTSSITNSSHMTEDATGIIIGGGSASAKLHVKDDVKFGTDGLFYDHSAKRVGLGTITPAQLLHVNGGMRLEGAFQDGSNSSGTSGQILKSNGTDTSWVNPNTVPYRENIYFATTWKIGTTATVFMNPTSYGDGSLGYASLFAIPYNGTLKQLTVICDTSQSGFGFALVNYQGTSLWSNSSQSLTANVAKTYTPNASLIKSTHRMAGIRMMRSTSASSNGNIVMTATFEWNV